MPINVEEFYSVVGTDYDLFIGENYSEMLMVLKYIPGIETLMITRSIDVYYYIKMHAPFPHSTLETYRWAYNYLPFDFT